MSRKISLRRLRATGASEAQLKLARDHNLALRGAGAPPLAIDAVTRVERKTKKQGGCNCCRLNTDEVL